MAIVLTLGVLLDYLLVLVIQDIAAALAIAVVLSCCGILLSILKKTTIIPLQGPVVLIFVYMAALYVVPVLFDPLASWDARSIWFLHGKMIYFNKGLFRTSFENFLEFSHFDYPQLVPVLAAQAAYVAGFWNEYVPKLSLLALLVPGLLGILSFLERGRIGWLFLLIMLPLTPGWLLWDGYMDGYLALFAALSLLFLGRWLRHGNAVDLYGGGIFLGVVLNLKNEGILFAICLILVITFILLLRLRSSRHSMNLSLLVGGGTAGLLPISCFAMWTYYKISWDLKNDLHLGLDSLERIKQHSNFKDLSLVYQALVQESLVGNAILLLTVCCTLVLVFRKNFSLHQVFPLLVAVLYFAGIFVIYLATPADLAWHLSTSASRTMLPVLLSFFTGMFFMVEAIEETVGGDSLRASGNI